MKLCHSYTAFAGAESSVLTESVRFLMFFFEAAIFDSYILIMGVRQQHKLSVQPASQPATVG